ncbi:ATP-binding protein [Segetibacter koreensis]|uniref:ATP-binding protein n=1 Tax=Segetibacter koreensis TaxID=398037 RepID=UPI0003640798|nr:ATP-binding protein [Segetibacter koreensis]
MLELPKSAPSDLMNVILANLLDAVLIVNSAGAIIYANKATENLFNKPIAQLLNHDFGFPVYPHEVQEIQVLQQNNLLTVQMLATTIEWQSEIAFLLSLRDITRQKHAEAELENERKRLEVASFENYQYASLASHDLKEPIRKIRIYIDLLRKRTEGILDDLSNGYIEKIEASGKRMMNLLKGIAEFSQFSGNKIDYIKTSLQDIVDHVCTDLELRIQETSALIEVDILPEIEANPVQMYQLFSNLISNSIKYCSNGTNPRIKIKLLKDQDDVIEIGVSDNGIGFDNKFADKIFQPFSRLHSANYDGSGIGLAICKKVLEAHAGSIYATSIPNQGSHFIFTLRKKQNQIY